MASTRISCPIDTTARHNCTGSALHDQPFLPANLEIGFELVKFVVTIGYVQRVLLLLSNFASQLVNV
ncbi:hypothetical protein CFIMG_002861RA [Ceratocystis fimbriata CBS 114723]|uniref:Uncharacterized protein n=1 Tax=Ceratocystis fimbriata CBS 114723 TaxID=1035309 RepID=A0A2C5X3J8_9PEZI|nr:hypothetical protein CFIMG_002861RA [Ceratocystis fimbriata CBS 114723]